MLKNILIVFLNNKWKSSNEHKNNSKKHKSINYPAGKINNSITLIQKKTALKVVVTGSEQEIKHRTAKK